MQNIGVSMVYNVFKNNHNLTDKQQQEALQDIVENAAYNIIYECSSAERNYRHNNDKLFPGVNNLLAVVDNDLFKIEVFNHILEKANNESVSRANYVSGFDLVRGEPYNPEEVDIVKNNVNLMKEQILRICDEVKDDVITKFDLLNMKRFTNDLAYEGHLVPRVQACIKDHDYKILTAQEKVAEKMKFVTDVYPEKDLRNFVKDIYVSDLKDQLKCAYVIGSYNINEYQHAFHNEFKDLIKHAVIDDHRQERDYGFKLSKTGLAVLDIKKEFASKILENVDENFEIFYTMVYKSVVPHIQDSSKLSLMDKLKQATFGSDSNIEADINFNKGRGIQNESTKENNTPKLKM